MAKMYKSSVDHWDFDEATMPARRVGPDAPESDSAESEDAGERV